MPLVQPLPLGNNGTTIQTLMHKIQTLDARSRTLPNGALNTTDANGNIVATFGNLGGGSYGIEFFDASGNKVLQIDQTGFHLYNASGTEIVTLSAAGLAAGGVTLNALGLAAGGVTVNSSGLTAGGVTLTAAGLAAGGGVEVNSNGLQVFNGATLELQAGKINTSPDIFGLEVLSPGGIMQQVAGAASATVITTYSPNTNGAWTTIGNVVTATVGSSGEAIVSIGCIIGTGAAGNQGSCSLWLDSALDASFPHTVASSAAAGVQAAGTSTMVVTGLSVGSHTFQVSAQCTGNYVVNFTNPTVTVTPL